MILKPPRKAYTNNLLYKKKHHLKRLKITTAVAARLGDRFEQNSEGELAREQRARRLSAEFLCLGCSGGAVVGGGGGAGPGVWDL